MSFLFKKNKNQKTEGLKAALYNLGSLFDYVALYFLLATAVEMLHASRKPTLNEYAFILITMLSWIMSLPYEWKLRWARIEGIVYVSVMAIKLITYVSISV